MAPFCLAYTFHETHQTARVIGLHIGHVVDLQAYAGVTENLGPTLLKISPFLTQAY